MPTAPTPLCSAAGCPNPSATSYSTGNGGPCELHRITRDRTKTAARGTSSERGYDSAWYRFLKRFRSGLDLDAKDPDFIEKLQARNRCAHCHPHRRTTTRLEFDHITPLSQGGARLDPANVQPLCFACHRRKTARETHSSQLEGMGSV